MSVQLILDTEVSFFTLLGGLGGSVKILKCKGYKYRKARLLYACAYCANHKVIHLRHKRFLW